MAFTDVFVRFFKRVLPSPFVIALILSAITLVLAILFGDYEPGVSPLRSALISWEKGLWNPGLLVFAYQMMLILVLGHVVVLSRPMELLIHKITHFVVDGATAALLVAVSTMLIAFFNWGLGLVFGAILARKVGEYASKMEIPLNYPLIGACGYIGLLVFNGGISGSAALKASEPGHISELVGNNASGQLLQRLPLNIPTSETIFNPVNVFVSIALITLLGGLAYFLGKKTPATAYHLPAYSAAKTDPGKVKGAEKLDYSFGIALFFGVLLFAGLLLQYGTDILNLSLTPNLLNLFMLALGVLLHGNIYNFQKAVYHTITGASGILIQFPLYFGIMGLMSGSGLIGSISDFFVSISTEDTYPFFTFLSAGLVNVFIPSGGGQWAVQGPVVIHAAITLNVPLAKALMALAYGDQLTNMMQPFWALPLLGITRLKAGEILPYSLIFMIAGGIIFTLGLFFWP